MHKHVNPATVPPSVTFSWWNQVQLSTSTLVHAFRCWTTANNTELVIASSQFDKMQGTFWLFHIHTSPLPPFWRRILRASASHWAGTVKTNSIRVGEREIATRLGYDRRPECGLGCYRLYNSAPFHSFPCSTHPYKASLSQQALCLLKWGHTDTHTHWATSLQLTVQILFSWTCLWLSNHFQWGTWSGSTQRWRSDTKSGQQTDNPREKEK